MKQYLMKHMKLLSRFLYFSAVGAVLFASCAKEESESFDKFEDMALEAWMTQNHPDLVKNLQDNGGYYVDVLEASGASDDVKPISDTACWVTFDFTGRDLSGNIIVTRNAARAHQVGTFTKYTHYVPYFRYCNALTAGVSDGTTLAMLNTLKLDEEYAAGKGISTEYQLREGDKVRLYLPSRVAGSLSVGSGGYEGQFSLDDNHPYIMEITILDTIKNPLEREGRDVDDYCAANGGLKKYAKEEETKDAESIPLPTDPDDPDHPYNVAEQWVSANDTIPQVYVNYRFNPADPQTTLKFPNPYAVGFEPYVNESSMAVLETKINEALVKRFHPDEDNPYPGIKELKADSVQLDGTANIWYIGRFLDGFIFDTNIDEVKELIYGEVASEGEAFSYKPEEHSMITAWYYGVPKLQYGQWAALVTTSTNAYGSVGQTGSSTTSSSGYSSNYLDYLNMMYYYNSLYGSSGY